ncbi:MAG TPA: uroporphyrinogen decarboxylase family protein [Armatimonadota bacterium]|nr:uroporphyrinogen decarboxylase family protein [Armatimonadota bacterium]
MKVADWRARDEGWSPDVSRLQAALWCRQPDRVPLAELKVDDTVKAAFLGLDQWPADRRGAMAADVEFARAAGYDAVRATAQVDYGATGHKKRHHYSANTEAEQERTWQQLGLGPIRALDDVEAYPWPDPEAADVTDLELASELAPPGMGIITALKGGGIFERAWYLLGFEGFMTATVENPELVAVTMERAGRVWYEVARRCLGFPRVSVLWFSDDLAYTEGFMVNPSIYRAHLFPWIERLGDLCRRRMPPVPLVFHSDGKLWDVLGDLMACGVNGLHPIEPKAMDIVEVKRRVQGRMCVIGNIDLGYTLTRGTPAEVEAEVRERIRTVGPGGGYCLGSSNSVTDYVPVANFAAMARSCLRYGRYPL